MCEEKGLKEDRKKWNVKKFDTCQIQLSNDVVWFREKMESQREVYMRVQEQTGVPWWIVGFLHGREPYPPFDFTKQILNGEPWDKVTKLVPKGLGPWENWAASAIDGIRHDKLHIVNYDDIGEILIAIENYNGQGYFKKGKPSPYIWSKTDVYKRGKYIRDGIYSPFHTDKQVGFVAACRKHLFEIRDKELCRQNA